MKAVKWAALLVGIALAGGILLSNGDNMPALESRRPAPSVGESEAYIRGMVELLDEFCGRAAFAGNWVDCGGAWKAQQPESYAKTCNNQFTAHQAIQAVLGERHLTGEMVKLLDFCTHDL